MFVWLTFFSWSLQVRSGTVEQRISIFLRRPEGKLQAIHIQHIGKILLNLGLLLDSLSDARSVQDFRSGLGAGARTQTFFALGATFKS
ncbi:MAG: hypothetical protein EBT08_07375 [Betaproteobacteria bacterium]|nr:hypothetical protein [Betaproteobacteria bacterium]